MAVRDRAPLHRNPGFVSSTWRPIKRATLATIGQDRARTSGSTYNRHSGSILLFCHFYLVSISWDFHAAGNHRVAIVNNLTNTPTELFLINSAFSATGGGAEDIISLPNPIILLPGRHYFSILKDGAADHLDDHNTPDLVKYSDDMWFCDASYNGGATGTYTIPLKLTGYKLTLAQLANYSRALSW